MDKFTQFTHKFLGVPNTGDTGANKGQCVGLVQEWINVFNLPQVWGHAKDIFDNAPTASFEKFKNKAGIYPKAGDIFCYNSSWGGGYGHIGVIISSDPKEDSYTIFEQNLPTGSPPIITKRKNWNGVIGWLRIKAYKPELPEEGCAEKVQLLDSKITKLTSKLASKEELVKTLEKSNTSLREAFRALEDEINTVRSDYRETITNLEEQIDKLEREANQSEPPSPPEEKKSFWDLIKIIFKGGV